MTLYRQDVNYKNIVQYHCYGDSGGASTQVLFQQDNAGINPFGICPAMPAAAVATRVALNFISGTAPAGAWTLRLRSNESLVTDLATASFTPGVALAQIASPWSVEALFQAGDRWFIFADGPSVTDIIIRATVEFLVL